MHYLGSYYIKESCNRYFFFSIVTYIAVKQIKKYILENVELGSMHQFLIGWRFQCKFVVDCKKGVEIKWAKWLEKHHEWCL